MSHLKIVFYSRYQMFHQKTFSLDLEQFPPSSNSIKFHINRSYLQAYLWYHAPFNDSVDLDPEIYGFRCDDDDNLFPIINDNCAVPESFPLPCKCLKCKRENVCPCRVKEIPCCMYCKCGDTDCCNPMK